jgi:hypothetical protein
MEKKIRSSESRVKLACTLPNRDRFRQRQIQQKAKFSGIFSFIARFMPNPLLYSRKVFVPLQTKA